MFVGRHKGKRLLTEINVEVARFRTTKMALILALLATLLSYSFDVECLLETSHGGREIVAQADLENCAQPTLPALVAALLPSSSTDVPTRQVHVNLIVQGPRPVSRPRVACRAIPLGLRAPPLA